MILRINRSVGADRQAAHTTSVLGALTPHTADPVWSSITDAFCTADSGDAWIGATSVAGVGDAREREAKGEVVGSIGPGLCVLVGVTHDDTEANARKLADKIWGLRVIDDDNGVMNRSIADTGGEVLIISQFTLYGDTSGGRRPSWINAARPEHAEPLVQRVVDHLRAAERR